VLVRPARAEDRDAIAAIQFASPEASSWDPTGYDITVAESENRVVGFLVSRCTAPDEIEVLNVAVHPDFRRRGIARKLLLPLLQRANGEILLEVRESNAAARQLYEALGFIAVGRRAGYYEVSREDGIVMKFRSC